MLSVHNEYEYLLQLMILIFALKWSKGPKERIG